MQPPASFNSLRTLGANIAFTLDNLWEMLKVLKTLRRLDVDVGDVNRHEKVNVVRENCFLAKLVDFFRTVNPRKSTKTLDFQFFCSTTLTSTGWVQSTNEALSALSLLAINTATSEIRKIPELCFELGPPGGGVWTLPLCYGGPTFSFKCSAVLWQKNLNLKTNYTT